MQRSDRIGRLLDQYQRLERELNLAWWQAATTGDQAAYSRQEALTNDIDQLFLDRELFAELSERRAARAADPIVAREDDLLYRLCWPRQVDPALLARLNELSTRVEQLFATYRPQLAGKEVSANDLDHVLKNSVASTQLEAAWRASKAVGASVEPLLLELVRLRNTAARSLGSANYYAMQLALNEQDEPAILDLFARLEAMTREPFRRAKVELDERLARRCRVTAAELRPWHYQNAFFQEAPDVFGVNIDAAFATHEIASLATHYYQSMGFDAQAILERSDLFERTGKNPHAFAIHIDRSGDARVLLNVRPMQRWMDTMLHELGHALYDVKIDAKLPFLLRSPAHTLTTEGIAMMMGRQAYNVGWLSERGLVASELAAACDAKLRTQELVFCRWALVMLHFERELYRDPDQNLRELWWQLVAKYQMLEPPPDRDQPVWASKIHLVSSPVYYHNYMMGALFASQVHAAIARQVGVAPRHFSYTGRKEVGAFLIDAVFRPGARHHYDELTRLATGAPLAADAFAAQFVSVN